MKTVLYARFSSKGQRHGTSLQRQLEDGQAYCQRKGWTVSEIITDEGRSAFHGAHRSAGNLGTFEAEALRGERIGTTLLVEKLDRLERGGAQATIGFITALTAAGVSIAVIDGDAFYQAGTMLDITQMMLMLLEADLAFKESAKKSDRSTSRVREQGRSDT